MAGALLRRSTVAGRDLDDLRSWTSTVEAWPAGSHAWGQYAERTADGVVICRTENVSACHAGFEVLVAGPLRALAGEALGRDVTPFKDKLNYKRSGGAGFSPHQDVLAYPGVDEVISVLVAVDACSTESGCLWLDDDVDAPLPVDGRGVVRPDVAASLAWAPVELAPGDAVCFDGCTPHYSEANRSPAPRRVLVATYAPVSDGYGRDRYYAARAAAMERTATDGGPGQISTIGDFEGVGVPVAATAGPEACTHD